MDVKKLENEPNWLKGLYALLLGQLVALLLSLISFSASLVASFGVDAPLSLSFTSYLALALVYGSILIHKKQKLRVPWYWYLAISFADVQGNFLYNKSYQYTSITSVTLLDSWTIAWVIVLTWLFLGTRYTSRQFFGAAICLLGLGAVLLSDAGVSGGGGSKPLLGDVLVIGGTFGFAISNVGEEFCVKKANVVEAISMIGLFGMLVTACETVVLERKYLQSIEWSTELILAFVGYAVSSFLFYSLVPLVLKLSGSTLFNLSLLTSDMWAVVIRIFFYKQQVDWLYYLAFALVVIGLLIYSKVGEKEDISSPASEGGLTPSYHLIDEENTEA
ncbi:hypothetical protein Leryth_017555 [Lithospermum erythrorhizon]|nr:hypothetical protein Leryth_017555 [Lithospermum erythrorhizon]